MIALEQQRRALLKTLGDTKAELQDVFRKENVNAATGVGESKDGVPMGKVRPCLPLSSTLSDPYIAPI